MCASSCKTQDHATWGECVRSQRQHVAYCQSADNKDYTTQKKWDAEVDSYRAAVKSGIQPEGTTTPKIKKAVELSNRVGEGYGTPAYEAAVLNKVKEYTDG
jgi:hypothetical protein